MLPEPNTPPITPPGISVSEANSSPLSCSNSVMQGDVWPGLYITLRRKLPRSIRLPSSSQRSILIGTFGSLNILRSIEKSSRSMILFAASRGAAVKVIVCADMVEVFVAQHHHVDIVGLDADMAEACQKMRVVRG